MLKRTRRTVVTGLSKQSLLPVGRATNPPHRGLPRDTWQASTTRTTHARVRIEATDFVYFVYKHLSGGEPGSSANPPSARHPRLVEVGLQLRTKGQTQVCGVADNPSIACQLRSSDATLAPSPWIHPRLDVHAQLVRYIYHISYFMVIQGCLSGRLNCLPQARRFLKLFLLNLARGHGIDFTAWALPLCCSCHRALGQIQR